MDAIDLKRLSDFVRHRQNEDGGFAFCKPSHQPLRRPSTLSAYSHPSGRMFQEERK
ncbi:hypothetical protein [Archaeoglobus sp.]|uniref:hypothetical protein n=1 Tax=Archaeoglobus sp. TaxID=1872626 RepID=UPI002584F307|nr:hypothetical protein [Archaeoglobus sp.]